MCLGDARGGFIAGKAAWRERLLDCYKLYNGLAILVCVIFEMDSNRIVDMINGNKISWIVKKEGKKKKVTGSIPPTNKKLTINIFR